MIADIFTVNFARAEIDIFRYTEPVTGGHRWHQQHEIANRAAALTVPNPPEVPHIPPLVEHAANVTEGLKPSVAMPVPIPMPAAAQITHAPKPKPGKLPKPPKPAPTPAPVLSKPNELGFHESTIKKALETFQHPSGKGTREQLLKHLEGYQGSKQEAELTGLHDWLKDKPNVSREDVLKHLAETPHKVRMEDRGLEDQSPKWRVVGDDGYGDDEYDNEDDAINRAHDLNQEMRNNFRNDFEIEGEEPHYTVDTSILEGLEDKEKELGGEMTMEASRALQRLGRSTFDDEDQAREAVTDYLANHLPNTGEWIGNKPLRNYTNLADPVVENPGNYRVSSSPLSSRLHSKHFDTNYDSEQEAQDAIDRYIDDNFEDPYSAVESEPTKQDTYEDWSLDGPKENYDETHVVMPGIRSFPQKGFRAFRPGTAEHRFFPTQEEAEKWAGSFASGGQWKIEPGAFEGKSITWKDGHGNFQHIDNPVVRIRHNDRETADGKSMFFVEEIQGPSDTNQEKMPKWVQDRIYDIGLKRALTKAVQGGHERMGWTTGDQQADRYNLRKHVDELQWMPEGEGGGTISGAKDGKWIINEKIKVEQLPEYVGREVAEKMLATPLQRSPSGNEYYSIGGQNLELGGRGLKDLYDRELHKRLLEIKIGDKKLKAMGVKIGTSEIPNGKWLIVQNGEVVSEMDFQDVAERTARANGGTVEQGTETVHSIDIPPELAAEIKRHGVSLYRRREEPNRYSRDFMDVIRKMPSQEAATVAAEMLRLMDLRPEYMRMFSTEEIGYLRGIVRQVIGK